MISLDVRGRARAQFPRPLRTRLVRRLSRAMLAAGLSPETEISLSLVDDDEIRILNRDYRAEDKPTDVLSFSQREGEGLFPNAPPLLGDIVISIETASRQAASTSRLLESELLHLSVHGLAHLLGYDHATKSEERVMFGYESELRAQAEAKGDVTTVAPPAWPPARKRK